MIKKYPWQRGSSDGRPRASEQPTQRAPKIQVNSFIEEEHEPLELGAYMTKGVDLVFVTAVCDKYNLVYFYFAENKKKNWAMNTSLFCKLFTDYSDIAFAHYEEQLKAQKTQKSNLALSVS